MERTWSGDSAAPPLLEKPSYMATFDANRPRPHRRRSSMPAETLPPSQHNQSLAAIKERRKFRENNKLSSSANLPSNGGSHIKRKRKPRPLSTTTTTTHADSSASVITSTPQPRRPSRPSLHSSNDSIYAAGPSASDDANDDSSSSSSGGEESSSATEPFRWDKKAKRSSIAVSQGLLAYLAPDSQPSTSNHTREPSPSIAGPSKRSLTPTGQRNPRSHVDAAAARTSPSPSLTVPPATRSSRAAPPMRKTRGFNTVAETLLLTGTALWACWQLASRPEPEARAKASEVGVIIVGSLIYFILAGRHGMIWSTDARSYRPCPDDGSMSGLLLGPLLATTMLFASLDDSILTPWRQRSPNQEGLASPPWYIEEPIEVLGIRNRQAFIKATPLTALALSRCTLVSLQTLISLILLIHLVVTRWFSSLQTRAAKSNWGRLGSYIAFSSAVTVGLFTIREVMDFFGLPVWTGLARWEVITASISFQTNMYTISRLGRGSFTLGELGIVAALGVTLMIETINLTLARLFPNSTLFLKTFRRATPLLIFQLALIVGTFFIGFLLSPLLYLSRHLAQKPVHRLRWPHKRDLHRRLLAASFYIFATAYVVGALGLWVRWLLGGRDPWFWTAHFVVQGQRWWTRPALVIYWLVWISASITGWQTVVSKAKRFRSRPPNAPTSQQPPTPNSAPHAATVSTNSAPSGAKAIKSWSYATSPLATETNFSAKLRRPAHHHLSLNARRKFFHALAVVLYTPAIAFDPAFTHLSFSLAFSVFTFAEYVRYYALYPFGAPLHVFMSEFTDHKDSGPVILSHFYLLSGCGGGLWLEGNKQISHHTGVLILGIGDALASVIGRRYGRLHWPRSSKTIEGSAAFMSSVIFAAWLLRLAGWCENFNLWRYSGVVCALCFMEGVSEQNDNLILPIYAFICLGLFGVA